MEVIKSRVFSSTGKFFLLGCFCGSVLYFLFSNKLEQDTSLLLDGENSMVALDPPTINSINKPSNLTIINNDPILEPNNVSYNEVENHQMKKVKNKECNMYDGRWVYKEDETPAYNALTCPLLETTVSCHENGRLDLNYLKWRWEARDCDIPL